MTENTAIKQLEIEGPFKQLPEKERTQFIKTPENLLRQTIGRVDQLDLFEKEKKKDDIKEYIETNQITSLDKPMCVLSR